MLILNLWKIISNFAQNNPVATQLTIGSAAVIGSALLAIGSLGYFSHLGFLSHNMAFIPIGLGTALCTAALLSLIYQRIHRGFAISPLKPVSDESFPADPSNGSLSSTLRELPPLTAFYLEHMGANLSLRDYILEEV